ncbi:hypothetical protein D5F01_LYC15832 [Larimichthys crocea]|uniref:Uncharacterized protein n=1 Tax=Larimichthys crocea TaxID=215358 RepID=A0A6G0I4H1_LARCR|nr:hypothetical protein D5F01_LYC15832 [Larimichthys crocea]
MKSLKRNRSLVRTEYVPWFDSQPGPSQAPQPEETMDRTGPPSEGQRGKRGNKQRNVRGEKPRFVFKVKLPKLNKVTDKEEDRTTRRWMLEPTRGQGAAADSDSAGGDVFVFSQRTSSKTINEKEKAKLTVLRTISKVLEENQLIRQRLSALSQAQ